MYRSKRYHCGFEDYENNGKTVSMMLEEILADPGLDSLDEIIIGCWSYPWEEPSEGEGVQVLIDGFVANADRLQNLKSLFIGDMDFEECEVSWIYQGDYSKLWAALPKLEKLTIKGSQNLKLGKIEHEYLKHLEIICGGLGTSVFKEITDSYLPSLEKLLLYIGVEEYGFDGDLRTICDLLENSIFPSLTYLGLTDSELQDEIAEVVLGSKYASQISTLDLSYGSLTDKGGQILLEQVPNFKNIKELLLQYHYMSEDMMKKLWGLSGVMVNVEDANEPDEYDGELFYYPMLTE